MPIYEFECIKCSYQFEQLCKIDAIDGVVCPSCHAVETKRLVSAPQFRLEGTGWYETDFKDKPKKQTTTTESDTSKAQQPKSTDNMKAKTQVSSTKSTSDAN